MSVYDPAVCHERLLGRAALALTFDPARPFAPWRQALEARLRQLLGELPEPCPLDVRVEWEREQEGFFERRFTFRAEEEADVPCHLLIPRDGRAPYPLVICLQGHSTGMHISLGRARYEHDAESIRGDRDFALQAVREGYAALALEQRCFGERQDARPPEARSYSQTCIHASMTALLLGRTMIGERVWDVSRAIDALAGFSEVDTTRVACMGNSGGGTITYYAACLEPRISVAMPSCAVCTYRASIARIDHCPDNYIPGALRWFEMGDLAGLIAPRPLIVVAGREDRIFPLPGVEETFATIQSIYRAAGAPERCRLVLGEGGHRFYAGQAWPVFRGLAQW